jgi:hypothetical protein
MAIREVWGSGGTASLVLDLYIELRRMVRFIRLPLFPPPPKWRPFSLNSRLIGEHRQSRCSPQEAYSVFRPGFELRIVGRPVRAIITASE